MSTVLGQVASTSVEIGGKEITFETGKFAKQADGAVAVRSGDTMVLATAVGRPEAREGADFFPLTVDVEERAYAAGKIPGGFFKREGRATERATLTARMIDRPIRPLWPKGFRNEVQVICTVLSADLITPHDILCINGASAALMLSPLPFFGPVGAVRIGRIDGEFVVNPTHEQNFEESALDLIVVGTKDGLTMIEAGASEVSEEILLDAFELAHQEIRKLCEAQEDLRAQAGKAKWLDMDVTAEIESSHGHAIWERIQQDGLREAASIESAILAELAPELSMDSGDEDIQRQVQVKASLAMLLEKGRLAAVEGPVREQFESELRALTDAEDDSKELKSAKRHLLFDRIVDTVELPFPVGPGDGRRRRPDGQGLAHEELRQEGRRGDLQGSRPQEDRDREAPAGRPRHRRDPADRVRGDGQSPRARHGSLPARSDAGALAADARYGEGGSADRRPLPRDRPPLHASLQLPAVLGRGDGLHARPEAA